jgi:hypothetical protein
MKRRSLIVIGAALGAGLAAISVIGQPRPAPLAGVWRAVEVTSVGADRSTNQSPQPRLYIFTAKHYSQIGVLGQGPRPDLPTGGVAAATADQLRASWGPFMANGGTYEVQGSDLITRPMVAKIPAFVTPEYASTAGFKLDGDTLTITTKATTAGPNPNPPVTKLARVE